MINFTYNKLEFYLAGDLTSTTYQREGIFENEAKNVAQNVSTLPFK